MLAKQKKSGSLTHVDWYMLTKYYQVSFENYTRVCHVFHFMYYRLSLNKIVQFFREIKDQDTDIGVFLLLVWVCLG